MDKQQKTDDRPKSLEDLDKYFKSRPERYDHYLQLLFKGGKFVILALIEENIENQEKTLKDILHEKEDFVRKLIDDQDQLKILYPSDQASSSCDISTWDIKLLATVFLQVLLDESVDTGIQEANTEIKKEVNTIVTLRNTYAEASLISLDSVAFNDRYKFPLYYSTQFLSGLLNSHNKRECDKIFTECKTKISGSQQIYLNELKNIKRIEDVYKERLKKLRNQLQDMDEHGVAFKRGHVLELKMIAVGTDKEKAHTAENILLQIWKEVLGSSPHEIDFPISRKELSKICIQIKKMKDVSYLHETQPSVILGVASSSPYAVMDLLNYFESAEFYDGLSRISSELGSFGIDAVITLESLEDILNDKGATELQQTKQQEKYELLKKGVMSKSYKYQSKQMELHDTYEQLRKEFKEDLAKYHRDRHSTIPLSPLFEEKDTPLLDFYLMPVLKVAKMENGTEVKTTIESLSEVYKTGNNFNHEIYVTADTGFGKTAFSKYLTVLWGQALFPDEKHTKHLKEESVNAMREFELLFLVLLGDSSDVCSIDDLIFNQIVQNLPHSSSYSRQFLQEILNRERCLVVLDGLDEWTHPYTKCGNKDKSIPHRKPRENCTIMTTTRPWKFSVTKLNTRQIDKKIVLTDMDHGSALELTTRALKKLKGETDLEMRNEAERLLKRYCDYEQVSVPLLLMYIICLWCDDIPVRQTKCGLYTSIIELLLSRTMSKYETFSQTELPQCISDIPQCFREQEHCKAYFTFLTALGELAFQTLFTETSENRLVFDSSIAEKCLKEDFLVLGRLTGIITQDKQRKLTSQIRKTSFSHKTVQEFFAALYISTCSDQDKVLTKVLSFCYSIQDILDLSKVFIFINGINAKLFSLLSSKLMEVMNKDEITSKYRSTTDHVSRDHPLRDMQDMLVSCITEIPDNQHVKICLQDFFFDKKCKQVNYYTSLQRLAVNNKTNIKSIYIYRDVGQSVSRIIDSCELSDPEIHCQKIHCDCECEEEEIIRLLSTSVKCLYIAQIQKENECKDACSCLTDEQCKTFHNSSQLETIHSLSSTVSHKFLNYVINVQSIKKFEVFSLSCSDHSGSCPGFNFDLSQHSELRKLYLHGKFMLCDTNKDESLLLHNMRNIEHVRLEEVKMSSLLLRHLVEIIKQLEHSVGVELLNSKITPREEFVNIRDDICRSESFVVKQDYRHDMVKGEVFEFETQK